MVTGFESAVRRMTSVMETELEKRIGEREAASFDQYVLSLRQSADPAAAAAAGWLSATSSQALHPKDAPVVFRRATSSTQNNKWETLSVSSKYDGEPCVEYEDMTGEKSE